MVSAFSTDAPGSQFPVSGSVLRPRIAYSSLLWPWTWCPGGMWASHSCVRRFSGALRRWLPSSPRYAPRHLLTVWQTVQMPLISSGGVTKMNLNLRGRRVSSAALSIALRRCSGGGGKGAPGTPRRSAGRLWKAAASWAHLARAAQRAARGDGGLAHIFLKRLSRGKDPPTSFAQCQRLPLESQRIVS